MLLNELEAKKLLHGTVAVDARMVIADSHPDDNEAGNI
jgi:hypothetical protein